MLRHALLIPILLLGLSGCNRVNLYSQLGEQQANEIVAILLSARIDADKEMSDGKYWVVTTDKHDLPLAVEVLRKSGYPREQFQSFGDIFKKDSIVSSPLEERARLIHGLSQELAHTLTSIDGVIGARVHVAVPEKEALSDKVRPSSASVFIKYRPDVDIATHVASIKALVVNSIEGLPYDNVTVTLFPGERIVLPDVDGARDPRRTLPGWVLTAAAPVAAVLLLALALLWWWMSRRSRTADRPVAPA